MCSLFEIQNDGDVRRWVVELDHGVVNGPENGGVGRFTQLTPIRRDASFVETPKSVIRWSLLIFSADFEFFL